MDDFNYLLNKEKNKKCIILGGGPNIKYINLESFDGVVISMGDVPIRIKERCKVDYWVSANSLFPRPDKHYEILNQFEDSVLIFSSSVLNSSETLNYNKLKQKLKIKWFDYDQRHFNGLNCNRQSDYRFDVEQPLNCCNYKKAITIQEYLKNLYKTDSHYSTGSTVAVHSLALAIIMGCKEIYLSGIDLPLLEKNYTYYASSKIKLVFDFLNEIIKRERTIPLRKVVNVLFNLSQKSSFYEDIPTILNDFEYLNNLCNNNDIKLFNLSSESTLNKIHNFKFLDPKAFNSLFTNN